MRKTLLSAILGWIGAAALFGQSPGDLNSGAQLVHDPDTNSFTFSWWGEAGRIYYLQQSEDLKRWDYLPVTEVGTSSILSWGFTTTADRLFLRLKHTELQGNPTEMDSDGDSIPDWEEIQENTDPFNQDTDGDGWYDEEEKRSNTDPRDEEDEPILKSPEEYVQVEARWVDASWTQSGGNKAYASWSWSWYSDDPPAGSWVQSSGGEYPILPVIGGYATFSDGREFTELSGMGEAQGKLDELSEVESGWAPSLGPWMVGSSYSEVSQGSDPGYPSEAPPNYPDVASTSAEWLVDLYKSWNGGAVELRLSWTPDAPRPERLTQVSVALQSQSVENGTEQQIGAVDLSIQPGEPFSTGGGTTGYGAVVATANVSAPATSTQKKITRYDIVPSEGTRGVIGDVVYSATTGSSIKHFITPQKSTDLPQTHVELEAKGIDATTFTQKFEWEGGLPGSTSNKCKVARDAPGKTVIKLKAKSGGAVLSQMYVWVVWCDIAPVGQPVFGAVTDVISAGVRVSKSGASVVFEATIKPSEIVDETKEIPYLKGKSLSHTPEVTAGPHALDGHTVPPPGALRKWDFARRWRAKSIIPTMSGADLDLTAGTVIFNDLPTAGKIHTTSTLAGADHYPANKLEANDYTPLARDPYQATPGILRDTDGPVISAKTRSGAVGDTIDMRFQFGEFVRLEIAGKWHIVSDFSPWRFHSKLRKVSEVATQTDYNQDGDMLDEVWIDDGVVCDYTNSNF